MERGDGGPSGVMDSGTRSAVMPQTETPRHRMVPLGTGVLRIAATCARIIFTPVCGNERLDFSSALKMKLCE